MFISVVLSTYNGEDFIKEQLLSILQQSRTPDEIIIGDDYSTDSTVKIIREILSATPFPGIVKIIERETNVGLYGNIKDLVKRCRGDLIVFSDQDDIWHPDKLRYIEMYFGKEEIKAVLTGIKAVDKNGSPLLQGDQDDNIWVPKQMKMQPLSNISALDEFCRNHGPGCSLTVRKEIADLFVKSDSKLIHDWQMCLIAAMQGGLYYSPKVLTYYRQHQNNTIGMNAFSSEDKVKLWRKAILILVYIRHCFFLTEVSELKRIVSYLCFKPQRVAYLKEIAKPGEAEIGGVNVYLQYVSEYWEAIEGRKLLKWLRVLHKYGHLREKQLFIYSFENKVRLAFSEIALIIKGDISVP